MREEIRDNVDGGVNAEDKEDSAEIEARMQTVNQVQVCEFY